MKKADKFTQFTTDLAHAMSEFQKSEAHPASFFSKIIRDAIPELSALKKERDRGSRSEWTSAVNALKLDRLDVLTIIEMASALVEILSGKINGNTLSHEIEHIFLNIILWIGDHKKNKAFFDSQVQYDLSNPDESFWFQRVDVSGTHSFNQGGIYLTNTIPPTKNNTDYYNAEIYNSPYTQQAPSNVIITPFPVDVITDGIELGNFVYDLFTNVPFAASHNVVFSAKIKVDNLKGGSRGWGFWNTNAIPVIGMKTAWFMQQEGSADQSSNGFFAHTFNGLQFSAVKLADLDEEWHEYQIVMNTNWVEYFIDGKSVARVTNPAGIPNAPMAFHNWVDNAVFTNANGKVGKQMQKNKKSRTNYTEYMRIVTMK